MILSCIVRAYPPPTAKIIKLSEDSFNSVDNEDDIELVCHNLIYLFSPLHCIKHCLTCLPCNFLTTFITSAKLRLRIRLTVTPNSMNEMNSYFRFT